MPISALPVPPQRSDPTNFADRADAFLTALPPFGVEANELQVDVNAKQAAAAISETNAANSASTATTKASEASTSAATATTQASNAAASALTAVNAPGTSATSTTSLTVGLGAQSLTIQTGKALVAGMYLVVASTASPANNMFGTITSYDGGTGALVVNVTIVAGSGTFANWTVSLSGAQGPTGAAATLSGTTVAAINHNEVDKGTVTSGTVTFTQSTANVQRLQVGGALTIATTGWPTSGTFGELLIKLVNAGAYAVTLPTINWIKPDGTLTTTFATYLTALSRPALQTSGTDFLYLFTDDAATTVYGKLL